MTFDKVRIGHGTREWSESSYNIGSGCRHACIYGFCRQHALRFGKIKTGEEWAVEHCSASKIVKRFGRRKGVIMMPTMHDITPGPYLHGSLVVLRSMLEAGNEVLVVSKPHLECVVRICEELEEFKDRLMFRFTIGSTSDDDLAFWEPGAPFFSERLASLHYARGHNYETSVSMEPLLCSTDGALDLVQAVDPLVTDTIWIGIMNKARERTAWIKEDDPRRPELETRLQQIERTAHAINLRRLFVALEPNLKVRWKDSIKAALNLPAQV